MKAVILAAGYGTRLRDELAKLASLDALTNELLKISQKEIGVAKALIPIKGKPLVQRLVEKIQRAGLDLVDIFIVTNAVFYQWFSDWANAFGFPLENILSDGTIANETRLGANRDLLLVIQKEKINDDLLVIAGDTLFEFNLKVMIDFSRRQNVDVAAYYQEKDLKTMLKRGMIVLDQDGRLIDFVEKPTAPTGLFACPSIYVFKGETLPLLGQFLKTVPELSKSDGPGFFIQWLVKNEQLIKGFQIPGRYDLGTLADVKRANLEFKS